MQPSEISGHFIPGNAGPALAPYAPAAQPPANPPPGGSQTMRFRDLVSSVRARSRALSIALGASLCAATASQAAATCTNTITANVVALDQPFFWNRMGAVEPQGMIFALRRDVVPIP